MSSTRITVERHIDADPTSTALLLAGPTALDLWPGVRRVGEVGGRLLVEAELPAPWTPAPATATPLTATPLTAASVTAHPPRRTPTAFVSRFSWAGPGLPATDGALTLTYAPGGEVPSTLAVLVLEAGAFDDSLLDVAALTAMAKQFLANLALAAESRRAA